MGPCGSGRSVPPARSSQTSQAAAPKRRAMVCPRRIHGSRTLGPKVSWVAPRPFLPYLPEHLSGARAMSQHTEDATCIDDLIADAMRFVSERKYRVQLDTLLTKETLALVDVLSVVAYSQMTLGVQVNSLGGLLYTNVAPSALLDRWASLADGGTDPRYPTSSTFCSSRWRD